MGALAMFKVRIIRLCQPESFVITVADASRSGLVGGADAVLVIDDTALPKKGKHRSASPLRYATVLGKQANCQTLMSLMLARNEVPVPIALIFRRSGLR